MLHHLDSEDLSISPGTSNDAGALLELFDDAVAWLVARGQTGQWGSEPFSARATNITRARRWAESGGLLFCEDDHGRRVGAIVLGDAHDYVPAPTCPELYVQVLLTASACRGLGVGAQLVRYAAGIARIRGAQQLRVDCWDGVPELPQAYQRLGFTRVGSFEVNGWPGAILVRPL